MSDLEYKRTAERLVKSRGVSALDYVATKVEEMEENGDEDNRVFWEEISKEVEKLLFEA